MYSTGEPTEEEKKNLKKKTRRTAKVYNDLKISFS
jgi:hypothetical protein